MGRLVLAILGGALVAGLVVYLVEAGGQLMYPPPTGMDMTDRDAMSAYLSQLPTRAFVIVLAAWVLGALAGSWVAVRIAARAAVWPGLVIGGLLLLGVASNVMTIPHPVWMVVAALIAIPAAAYAGARLAVRGRAAPAPPEMR